MLISDEDTIDPKKYPRIGISVWKNANHKATIKDFLILLLFTSKPLQTEVAKESMHNESDITSSSNIFIFSPL